MIDLKRCDSISYKLADMLMGRTYSFHLNANDPLNEKLDAEIKKNNSVTTTGNTARYLCHDKTCTSVKRQK